MGGLEKSLSHCSQPVQGEGGGGKRRKKGLRWGGVVQSCLIKFSNSYSIEKKKKLIE